MTPQQLDPQGAETEKAVGGEKDRLLQSGECSEVKFYNGAVNDYDLAKDPRCLFGWGGCGHGFGHACFRQFGHKGKCWDAGDSPVGEPACYQRQRPADWDRTGRVEANR